MTSKKTRNRYGATYSKNTVAELLINHLSGSQLKASVLDLGCAYGVNTLPLLVQRHKVTAIDKSPEHIEELQQSARETLLDKNLTTIVSTFPSVSLPNSSFHAVLASQVFPFLSGDELELGMEKIFNWLKPGGKLFVLSYTIYNKLTAPYIPEYERRKTNGDKWPGFLEDFSQYWDSTNPLKSILPKKLNHLDVDTLSRTLQNAGFNVDSCEYLNLKREIHPDTILDGREVVGAVATKPGTQ